MLTANLIDKRIDFCMRHTSIRFISIKEYLFSILMANSKLIVAVGLSLLVYVIFYAYLGPGIFYAKLQSDSSVYLAQARHLWDNGPFVSFCFGDGLDKVVYSSVSAYFRAPIFSVARSAPSIVHLVQLENIAFLLLYGLIARWYLIARLPLKQKCWANVQFFLMATTYNPWLVNLALPMSDHVYGIFTMASVLFLVELEKGSQLRNGWSWVIFCVAGILASLQKFAGFSLFFCLVRLLIRKGCSKKIIAMVLVAVALLGLLELDLIFAYASMGKSQYLSKGSFLQVAGNAGVNLVFAAIPNQIVPNFSYLFARDFSATHALLFSAIGGENLLWAAVGGGLTATILLGAVVDRKRLGNELLLLVVVVPVYSVATNSTTRYLSSIQPVFVVLFLSGIGFLLRKLKAKVGCSVSLIVGLCSLATALIVGIVSVNISKSFTAGRESGFKVLDVLNDLNDEFENLERVVNKISTEDRMARFLLVTDELRWYSLSRAKFVAPRLIDRYKKDGYHIYIVFGCDLRNCPRLLGQYSRGILHENLGAYRFDNVYYREGEFGRVFVDRVAESNR